MGRFLESTEKANIGDSAATAVTRRCENKIMPTIIKYFMSYLSMDITIKLSESNH